MRNYVIAARTAFFASLLGLGCGAGNAELETTTESVASTERALTNEQVCAAANAGAKLLALAKDRGFPESITVSGTCQAKAASNITYLGSTAPAQYAASGSRLEGQTLFCGLKAADGTVASASVPTGLGRFGAGATLNIVKADPVTGRINAQRLGTVEAFGVALRIENHPFDWSLALEKQPRQQVRVRAPGQPSLGDLVTIPEHWGQYAAQSTNGIDWSISGSGTAKLGIIDLLLSASYFQRFPFEANNARAYSMSNTGKFELGRRSSWDSFVNACNECRVASGGSSFCDCPTIEDTQQHNRTCNADGCTETFYQNLADGRLPHEGRRGSGGQFFERGQPGDFWHYGKPGAGAYILTRAPSEAIYDLTNDSANATAGVRAGFGFGYEMGVASAAMKVDMVSDIRTGVAVRVYRKPLQDTDAPPVATEVAVDAEAAFSVDTRFIIKAKFPILGETTLLDERIPIIKRRTVQSPARLATSLTWDERAGAGTLQSFTARGVPQSLSACLTAPPQAETPFEANDPEEFVETVGEEVEDNLHPCNVTLCTPEVAGGAPRLHTCNWDATLKTLKCTRTGLSCGCHQNRADMCDALGNVYKTPESIWKTNPTCNEPE